MHSLDSDFKNFQYELIATIDEADCTAIEAEQNSLDKPTDIIYDQLNGHSFDIILELLEATDAVVKALLANTDDMVLLEKYQEKLSDSKGELALCRDHLSQLHGLHTKYSRMKTIHFNCCRLIKTIIFLSCSHYY